MFGVSASGSVSKNKSKTSTSNEFSNVGQSSGTSGVGLGGLVGHFKNAARQAKLNMQAAPESVYQGPRVAAASPDTEIGYAKTRARAAANEGFLDQALGDLAKTSGGGHAYAPQELLDLIQSGGAGAANRAFSGVNRQFQGSGFGSPLHSILSQRAGAQAMGETAIPALAGLYGAERDRMEKASRDIPGMYTETSRAPGDLFREIGMEQEARAQAGIQGEQDRLAEMQDARDMGNQNYLNTLLGIGQMFRTQDQKTSSAGKSKSKTKTKSKASSVTAGGSYGF